ncbi:TonB family protein [Methylobacterium sp. A54F]
MPGAAMMGSGTMRAVSFLVSSLAGGPIALPSAVGPAQAESLPDWAAQASREIRRSYRPPAGYGHPAAPLTTLIRFAVDREGRISQVMVAQGSGLAGLDAAALRAVRAAQPLKPPPLPPGKDTMVVNVPITFQ